MSTPTQKQEDPRRVCASPGVAIWGGLATLFRACQATCRYSRSLYPLRRTPRNQRTAPRQHLLPVARMELCMGSNSIIPHFDTWHKEPAAFHAAFFASKQKIPLVFLGGLWYNDVAEKPTSVSSLERRAASSGGQCFWACLLFFAVPIELRQKSPGN